MQTPNRTVKSKVKGLRFTIRQVNGLYEAVNKVSKVVEGRHRHSYEAAGLALNLDRPTPSV